MKRFVHAAEESGLTNADLVRILNEHGIDTTKSTYELKAEEYERYGNGRIYTKKFTCPGDYLAYFSMTLHAVPNAKNIEDAGYDLEEFIEANPTVEDIKDYATSTWWGDGDDYIIYLKKSGTEDYLYGPEYSEEEYEEEEDWED